MLGLGVAVPTNKPTGGPPPPPPAGISYRADSTAATADNGAATVDKA